MGGPVPLAELVSICGPERVVTEHAALRTYESDGLLQYAVVPAAAVLPDSASEVAAVVAACHRAAVPWVARGSGTGLSGGSLPVEGGVVISLSRMRRILDVDLANQRVVVEPGVTNAQISAAVGPTHFYPPDPSSQIVCSIGGNVAENSGGVHCFKYGFTTNWVVGAEVVLPDGTTATLGGAAGEVGRFCEGNGATGVRIAGSEDERLLIWKARKAAFAAMGRISPNFYVQDGVIPCTRLPQVLGRIEGLAGEYGLRVANVFHAGDGNLHPLVLFDSTIPGQAKQAEELAGDILKVCVDAGGSITGEHGVGLDKKRYMPVMFTSDDLNTMQMLRCAIDPDRRLNPDKVFPTPRLCGERPGPYKLHPLQEAGIADIF